MYFFVLICSSMDDASKRSPLTAGYPMGMCVRPYEMAAVSALDVKPRSPVICLRVPERHDARGALQVLVREQVVRPVDRDAERRDRVRRQLLRMKSSTNDSIRRASFSLMVPVPSLFTRSDSFRYLSRPRDTPPR
jgi:hypothetical protein